jgi:hypothetical protein
MTLRHLTIAALAVGCAGCHSLQPVSNPSRYIAETHPPVVHVKYKNGARVSVAQPRVSGDSLYGTWQQAGRPVAMPLGEAQRIDARQYSKKRTTMLIVGTAAVAATLGYFLMQPVDDQGPSCDDTGVEDPLPGCDTPANKQ